MTISSPRNVLAFRLCYHGTARLSALITNFTFEEYWTGYCRREYYYHWDHYMF